MSFAKGRRAGATSTYERSELVTCGRALYLPPSLLEWLHPHRHKYLLPTAGYLVSLDIAPPATKKRRLERFFFCCAPGKNRTYISGLEVHSSIH